MCIATVPVIRGERLMGAAWQREQFVANTCSPVTAEPGGVVGGAACFVDTTACRDWPASKLRGISRRHADIAGRFIVFLQTRGES